jgi:Ca2+-binding EF-hand superfamily protein
MGFLTYQQDNQNMLIADVMLGEERMTAMLEQLKKGSQSVWDMVPFLPQELINELTSEEFEVQCMKDFASLDADGSGALEPRELLPIIQSLTQAHEYVLTDEHCRRFVDIFDFERNGVITQSEFVHFVRFMMIMSFMETPEGQISAIEAEVDKGNRDVEKLIKELERDRDAVAKVMPLLPQDIYNDMTSPIFIADVRKTFQELDKDHSGVLEPSELYPLIVDMTASHPYAVSLEQCTRFTAIFDLRGDGVLRQDEFLDFTRFLCIMSYLSSDEGQVAAAEALTVLDDSKRIEDLIDNLQQDREAVSKVYPYLPSTLRQELLSEKFTVDCMDFFQSLDKDGNGMLDPEELMPMVRELTDAHDMAFDEDKCRRFASVFDDNGDNMIEAAEFVVFARFMMVLAYLESQEGQLTLAIAQEDQETRELLAAGQKMAPPTTPEVMDSLPEPPPLLRTDVAADPQGAHMAVDYEFYRDKADKLNAENDTMREHMSSLEAMVRKMQRQIEEQDIKLRHAEVDLRATRGR